jgi:hypothetical protein
MAMFVKPRSREAVAPQAPGLYEHRHPWDPDEAVVYVTGDAFQVCGTTLLMIQG